MKIKYLIITCVFLFGMQVFAQSAGENSSGKTYTLDECISIALQQNIDIKNANGQITLNEAGLKQAKGAYLPSANFSAGYSRDLNPEDGKTVNVNGQIITTAGSNPNSYNMSAGVNYTIYNGWTRSASRELAEFNMQKSKLTLKQQQDYIRYYVRKLFIEVVKGKETLKIQEENRQLGLAEYDAIKAKFEAGKTHEGEVLTQETDLANREYSIVEAENNLNIAKANLMEFIGLVPDTETDFTTAGIPSDFSDDEISNFSGKYANLEDAINSALHNRPEIQSGKIAIESGKSSLKSSKSGYYPEVTAGLGWSWSNTKLADFANLSREYLSLGLSVPIFDQYRTNYQIESAKYDILQAETSLYNVEQSVRIAIRTAFLNLEASRKQLDITKRALTSAEKNYDIMKTRFDVGASNITEYQTANNSYVTARLNRVNAIYSYYMAEKELEYQTAELK